MFTTIKTHSYAQEVMKDTVNPLYHSLKTPEENYLLIDLQIRAVETSSISQAVKHRKPKGTKKVFQEDLENGL